ncbi:hypothetical protein N9C10_03645 [Flavobacteriaceae bacterium]|nr:hypothetical protein [Flavobacteriaceae bacterium]
MENQTYIFDIDSSERDPLKYTSPNDYVIKLNRRMYNVTNIKLVSALIPNSQLLINKGNKQFDVGQISGGSNVVVLPEGSWSNGYQLASNLTDSLVGKNDGNDISVAYEQNTQALTFTSSSNFSFDFYDGSNGFVTNSNVGTPAEILGFPFANTTPATTLVSNVVNFYGPSSIILGLSSGSSVFDKMVYIDGGEFSFGNTYNDVPVTQPLKTTYMGRILTSNKTGDMLDYNGRDDPVDHRFYRGPENSIDRLRVKFFYNNGSKLIPYDFGNRNHVLKFEFTCSLDKLNTLERNVTPTALPPPIEIERKERISYKQKQMFIIIAVALCVGLILLSMFKRPAVVVS